MADSGHFSECDFHRELLPIFVECSELVTLPVQVPLSRRQIPSVSILMYLPQEFWHQHSHRLSNHLSWFIPKNSHGGGICSDNYAVLVHTHHGVTSRVDHHAVFLFGLCQFARPLYDTLFEFLIKSIDLSLGLLKRGRLDNDPLSFPPCKSKLVRTHRI